MTTTTNIRIEALKENRNFVYNSLRRDFPNNDTAEVAKAFAAYFVASSDVDNSELDYTEGAEIEIGYALRSFMIADPMGTDAAIAAEEAEAFNALTAQEKAHVRLHNFSARVYNAI